MFFFENNIVSVILYLILQLADVKTLFLSGADNNTNNGFGDNIDTDSYSEYDDKNDSECQLSELPPDPTSMCCGVDVTSSNRIVGGLPTLIKQYPWLARIEYEASHYLIPELICGGSLISGLYVLTAAHCVVDPVFPITPVNVVLGDYNRYYDGRDCVEESEAIVCTDGEVRIPIAKTIPHENNTYVGNISLSNDIALIKLTRPAPYTDFIRPICLPTSDLTMVKHDNLWLSVAGWGYMLQLNTTKEYFQILSDVKRHVSVPYVSLEDCSNSFKVSNCHICAGGEPGEDSCVGDSGGPLMYNNDGQYQLAGAVSFGVLDPCGTAGVPGVYTNVYRYLEWIKNVISQKTDFQ